MLTPQEDLRVYEWHTGTAKDYFCPTCGIMPFRKPRAATAQELAQGMRPFVGWAINARCLEGVDLSCIPVRQVDGAALD
ncbi:GFA family protein [Paracidovorax avenae]